MKRWLLRVLTAVVLSVADTLAVAQSEEPIEVIVAAAGTPQVLPRNAVRAIFGMRLRNWPNGDRVRVFVLRDHDATHVAFCKGVINIFPHQLRLAWDRLVFSGTGQAPTEVGSEHEMLAKIATTPGAVGYLRRSTVDDSVRVLQIQ